jgi:hypothetical protein
MNRQNTILPVTGKILGGLLFAACLLLILTLGTILLD